MPTIVKTPSGTWKAVVRKTGWPTTAKTFRVKRDAVDWARRLEDEMVRGMYVDRSRSERMLVRVAIDRYLREVTPTKGESTQKGERVRGRILAERLGRYSLVGITADIVARYRDDRLMEGKSNTTVRLELALLGHLFSVAIKEWGLGLPYNPVANVRKPAPAKARNRRLSAGEEERLLGAVDQHSNPMLGWITRIAFHTAMRQGEILSLHRDQVDLERRVVRLDKTKNGDSRTVPLSKRATEVFQQALEHPMHHLVDTPLLFFGEPGGDGKRRPYVINKVWATAVARAGLKNFRFHDLRHEAVSQLVEAGLTDQQVAAISGHRSMQMLKRYTHLRAEDLVAHLDRALD
jgi:integrase